MTDGSQAMPPVHTPPPDVISSLQSRLNAQIQQNVRDLQELQQRGIAFDPNQITNARIDMVISAVAEILGPQGKLWELRCRMAFEDGIAQNIKQARSEGTKAMLSQGGLLTPAGIRDLARKTGTFGGR